jgi:hypothetical protein
MRGAVPCLGAIQRRVQLRDRNRIQLLSRSSPVVYIVFDLLYLRGDSIPGHGPTPGQLPSQLGSTRKGGVPETANSGELD